MKSFGYFSLIGYRIWCHFNQSNAKLKPIKPWSPAFSRPSWSLLVFTLSLNRLLVTGYFCWFWLVDESTLLVVLRQSIEKRFSKIMPQFRRITLELPIVISLFLLRNPINLRFVSAAFITPWLIYQQLFVCLFVCLFFSLLHLFNSNGIHFTWWCRWCLKNIRFNSCT